MDQIQQHEWVKQYKWFSKCPHCKCVKITPDLGTVMYSPEGISKSVSEEPTCITRIDDKLRFDNLKTKNNNV